MHWKIGNFGWLKWQTGKGLVRKNLDIEKVLRDIKNQGFLDMKNNSF